MGEPTLLQQALHFARQGQHSQAVVKIQQHIKANPSDAAGWWALANLTTDDDIKRKSLKRVLKLVPDHQKATTMLAALSSTATPDWMAASAQQQDDLFAVIERAGAEDASPSHTPFGNTSPTPAASSRAPTARSGEAMLRSGRQQRVSKTKMAKSVSQRAATSGWGYIWGVVGLMLMVIAVGVVYFLFFAGPNLSERTENDYVSLRYPDDWVHQHLNDRHHTIIMGTEAFPAVNIDPWSVIYNTSLLSSDTLLARCELQYWLYYYEWGRGGGCNEFGDPVVSFNTTMAFQRLRSDRLAVAVFQAIPDRNQRPYDGADYVRAMSQWFEGELESVPASVGPSAPSRDVITDFEDIEIDGNAGMFASIQIKSTSIGGDSFESIYVASTTVDDVDYILVFSCIERKLGEWKATAMAMGRKMELSSP